jgi:hypothetical protein
MKLTRVVKNGIAPTENPEILESKIHSRDSKEKNTLQIFQRAILFQRLQITKTVEKVQKT